MNVVSIYHFYSESFGLLSLRRQWKINLLEKEVVVFSVVYWNFLIGVGSSYYHWSPDNSLMWDRIPMTIVFMSLLSLTLMERINLHLGFWLLVPLIAFGIFSVFYWHWTELLGRGDLRLYGLVQFYSMVLIVTVLYLFPKSYPPLKAYIWMFIFYGIAKILEGLDLTIYGLDEFVSGHTLKHIFAALSTYGAIIILNNKGKASASSILNFRV